MLGSRVNQTKIDSFIEQVFNVGSGFILAALVWEFIINPLLTSHHLTVENTLPIVTIFTLVSVIRGYVWRRIFNGKQPWARIKKHLV